MLLKIRTHVHIRVHILRVNFQLSNQSDRVDADARIVQHRGKRSTFFREKKKRFAHEKKIERKKCLGCKTLIKGLGQKGERKKKKVRHKTISESIHHGEFIRRVARTNLEQYA
jgi:hypothetical protein